MLHLRPEWRKLSSTFRDVPLGLKLLEGPIDPRNANIVQLDIHDSRRFGEYVRIWPGAPGSEVRVIHVDRKIRQLVLHVRDRRRAHAWEERRFLCGKDDVRLFIAQVATANSVTTAHLALEPPAVKEVRRDSPGAAVVRQGEWFFLPLKPEEIVTLETYLAGHPRAIKRWKPISESGRPHTASELVRIHRPDSWQRFVVETFARGEVSHVGHNVLHLDGWRRVVRNREINDQNVRIRMRWID